MDVIYLVGWGPLIEGNRIEIFNETCIMLCAHIVNVFLNIAVPLETRDLMGWVLMGIAFGNILVNLIMVVRAGIMQIIRDRWLKKRLAEADKMNTKTVSNRHYLIEKVPGVFDNFENSSKIVAAVK
jgi:hypothetical protein